jgi:glutathione S-transferase
MAYRLYTLAPSHYCERARWALDRAGIGYEEVRLAPGPHVPRVRKLGVPGTSLPVLERPDEKPLQGSARILDWAGLPGGDAELEARLEERTAP